VGYDMTESEMRKNVGYFEGTDPLLLTRLVAHDIDTVPISNGLDNHGKEVRYLTRADEIEIVVGYLHKVVPLDEMKMTTDDMLFSCVAYQIPILLILPEDLEEKARAVLGDVPKGVRFVAPEDAFDEVMKILG
jgi:hypothetical protein